MIEGIPKNIEDKIIKVLAQFPAIQSAIVYGSRLKNQHRKGSDIDLVLKGRHLNFQTLLAIDNKIDDLLLPYKVDLSLDHFIKDPLVKREIGRWGRVIYKNQQYS